MAIVDANYKFIYIEAGAAGRAGDAGIFNDSAFINAFKSNSLDLPPPSTIEKISYHLVGDDAFALTTNMMKPYPHRSLNKQQRVFNYRLSRARRVAENAFGIFAHRFRVFLSTIRLSPEKVTYLILATCCLHNYLIDKHKHTYTSAADVEQNDCTFSNGLWREDPSMVRLNHSTNRNSSQLAKHQRILLTNFFSGCGSVPWQNDMI